MLDQKNDTDHWGFAFDFIITLRCEITNEVRKRRFIHVIQLFKGTVDPKMTILLLFTHSHAVPNLYEFISSVEHKDDMLEKGDLKPMLVPNGFHCMDMKTYF